MLTLVVKYVERIDKYIAQNSHLSRSEASALIKARVVTVNGIIVRKSKFLLKEKQEIIISEILKKMDHLEAQNLPLEIIYENDNYLIVNKAKGMVSHPAPGHHSGTLVNALLFHIKKLSNENGLLRPGIIHRLDKDTSGLLIVAKTNEAHQLLSEALQKRLIKRTYLAVLDGHLRNKNYTINLPLGRNLNDRKKITVTNFNSKEAITKVELLELLNLDKKALSLVRCQLETGRTHQIRVHLAYLKHPVYNDQVYGKEIDGTGQYLQAYQLQFVDPFTSEMMHFELPLDPSIKKLLVDAKAQYLKTVN